MLFVKQTIEYKDLNTVQNLINDFDTDNDIQPQEVEDETSNISKYLTSFATGYYQKAVEDIENTKVGNRVVRKRNLTQVMKESFFYGANRFGNNYIA